MEIESIQVDKYTSELEEDYIKEISFWKKTYEKGISGIGTTF